MDRKYETGSNSEQGDLARLQSSARDVDRWQTAQQHVLGGRFAYALDTYNGLVKRFPGVAQLWFELGIAAGGELDFPLATQALHRAAELAANDPTMLILVAQQFHRLRRLDDARKYFQAAVAAEPGSVPARISLADWFERERRWDDAWENVEACLAAHPQDDQARYFRAFLLYRKGRHSEAESALRQMVTGVLHDPNARVSSRHLLGVVLDELGQYAEAMQWLREAKSQLRKVRDTASLEREYDKGAQQRRQLVEALTPAMIQRWRDEASRETTDRQLALLGGHPRSGTTLLEQVLGAHPQVLAFDESEAFVNEIGNQLAPTQAAKPLTAPTLDAIDSKRLDFVRRRYLKSFLREASSEPKARVLVDKNPSTTSSLHLFLRVFGNLKVIIAMRDPRDTIISCFFQNLALTSANVNFLSLERTARHYADMMDIWLRLRELGGFDWIETRYEDMVVDLETEGQKVTKFLGLDWHPEQAAYYETAQRKFVFAPTYSDVTKPVYTRAVKRWEHYAEALEPVRAQLAPYCKAFGYQD
jgi:tetratricopeptide (TPR) repeat protein